MDGILTPFLTRINRINSFLILTELLLFFLNKGLAKFVKQILDINITSNKAIHLIPL